MKQVRDFLAKTCSYTVLMLLLVFIFAQISGLSDKGISFSRFAVVFGYALLISIANLIRAKLSFGAALRTIVHYALTLAGFIFVYAFLGNMESGGPAKIFVAIFLFTALYALISSVGWLLKKHAIKDSATPASKGKTTGGYTSLYGDN